jgi:hypothetical protein
VFLRAPHRTAQPSIFFAPSFGVGFGFFGFIFQLMIVGVLLQLALGLFAGLTSGGGKGGGKDDEDTM